MDLRTLSVPQQVALLFVVLFGALTIATAVVVLRGLRESAPVPQPHDDALRRGLRALWIAAIIFWVAWAAGALVATLLFGIVSFLALREFITLTHTRRADHRALLAVFFMVLPLQYVLVGIRTFDWFTVFIPVYAFAALPMLAALGNDPTRFLERTAKIQWGTMVCVYGLSHVPALLLLELRAYEGRGAFLVIWLVAVVAAAQLMQQVAATRLRRRPVARHISRSFTWPAWGLGALAAAAVGLAFYWITPFGPAEALLIGSVTGSCGTLGELVVQAVQRDAGLVSRGQRAAVTGAVGLLDRVAPLSFAGPVFFHSVRWWFAA